MTSAKIVLLPGLDGTGELFEPFVRTTPPGFQTIVVEYPVDESALDVLATHAREKLVEGSIILAESFSGPIAVRIASDVRVRALVLCNSFVSSPVSPLLRHLMFAPIFGVPIPGFLIRSLLLGPQASPVLLEKTERAIRRIFAGVLTRRLRQIMQANEVEGLRSLAKPVLYLRGNKDRLVSENCGTLVQKIRPDAQIAGIEGPHMLLQVSPIDCWAAISRFVEGIED